MTSNDIARILRRHRTKLVPVSYNIYHAQSVQGIKPCTYNESKKTNEVECAILPFLRIYCKGKKWNKIDVIDIVSGQNSFSFSRAYLQCSILLRKRTVQRSTPTQPQLLRANIRTEIIF